MNYINTKCPQKNKLKSKISSDFAILDKLVNSYDYHFIRWKGETDILGLNKELTSLKPVFLPIFQASELFGGYDVLIEAIELAYFLKRRTIKLSSLEVSQQLSFNSLLAKQLHHSKELTPLVASQLPYPTNFDEHPHPADMLTEDIWIEVGRCRISKVLEVLDIDYVLWVLPSPYTNIYRFTRGGNWKLFLEWKEYQFDVSRQILNKITESTN